MRIPGEGGGCERWGEMMGRGIAMVSLCSSSYSVSRLLLHLHLHQQPLTTPPLPPRPLLINFSLLSHHTPSSSTPRPPPPPPTYASSSSSPSPSPPLPPHHHHHLTPLFQRPPSHPASLPDLLLWKTWARQLALSVGTSYARADGGPDSHELLRELDWLLEDAVAHFSTPSDSSPRLPCDSGARGWRELKHRENMAGAAGLEGENPPEVAVVSLRATIDDLTSLWRQRVEQRRPFQYVVGCAHWRDLVLCVQEGVLIPRPETELLVDLAEAAIKANSSLAMGPWADLGTGSGALAIGLARLLGPANPVVAVDESYEAIRIANQNVQRYRLQDQVEVIHGSWFSALEDKKGKLAGVLSNPPYIPSHHISHLQTEVGMYEPRCALDGGQEGMDDLIIICQGSSWALCSGGFLGLETNGGKQAENIADFLNSMPGSCFHNVQIVRDFAGIMRFVTAIHN